MVPTIAIWDISVVTLVFNLEKENVLQIKTVVMKKIVKLAAYITLAVLTVACGNKPKSEGRDRVELTGAGATFLCPSTTWYLRILHR